MPTLQFKRGLKSNLPTSGMFAGEPLLTTDRGNLYAALTPTTKLPITPAIDDLVTISTVDAANDLLILHDANATGEQKEKKITVNAFKAALDISGTGEVNVQADWNQIDNLQDDYIKNKPASLPASDVYSWAKASTKPTYTHTEVGAEQSGAVATHAALSTGVHGSGANSLVFSNDIRLTDARTPTTHSHAPSDITGTAVITSDSRLSDARTPTAHNQAESTITFTDITTGNATTGQHGFLPKLGGGTANFLRADGTWAAPAGGSGLTYSQTLSVVSLRV